MKAAVLGCGSIGLRHAKILMEKGLEVFVYDSSKARLAVARRAGATIVPAMADLWRVGPDIAAICTPTPEHAGGAIAALEAGSHVFIEKPIASNKTAARAIAIAHERSDCKAMVACNMRFHPGPRAIRTILAGGWVGRPVAARIECGSFLPSWRSGVDYKQSYSADVETGGAILDIIHELDLAAWMLGPADLHAAVALPATSIGLQTDGLGEMWLRHEGDVLSSVHVNFIQREARRCVRIIGETGSCSWDNETGLVVRHGANGEIEETQNVGLENTNQLYVDQWAHFLDHLGSSDPPMNGPREAERALNLALQARSCAW